MGPATATAVVVGSVIGTGELYWLLARGRQTAWPHLIRDCGVSALALAFSFWSLAGSGYQAVFYGILVVVRVNGARPNEVSL